MELSAQRRRLEAEAAEVGQALAAGDRAAASLEEAARRLASAADWSSYDTWFGGGMVSSSVKHDRIAAAARAVETATHDLLRLDTELGPVRDRLASVLRDLHDRRSRLDEALAATAAERERLLLGVQPQ